MSLGTKILKLREIRTNSHQNRCEKKDDFEHNLAKFAEISEIQQNMPNRKRLMTFCEKIGLGAVQRNANLVDLEKSQQIEYLLAKIGVDTAENEPLQIKVGGHSTHLFNSLPTRPSST